MLKVLGKENSLLNQYISEIRNVNIQKDRMRFRRNFERIGEIFAYEISKDLAYGKENITTSLGQIEGLELKQIPVLATIMRAGLPFHRGMLNYFDHSENAFVSIFRKHHKSRKAETKVESISSPDLKDKTLILADPMLASGVSMALSYKELITRGKPTHTHLAIILASEQGINYIQRKLPDDNITLWVGEIDDELTAQGYIVPGLGDAGDLAFGSKK